MFAMKADEGGGEGTVLLQIHSLRKKLKTICLYDDAATYSILIDNLSHQ